MIDELLERQELMEQKLSKIEAVLIFEDEDFENVTGVKKQFEVGDEKKDNGSST